MDYAYGKGYLGIHGDIGGYHALWRSKSTLLPSAIFILRRRTLIFSSKGLINLARPSDAFSGFCISRSTFRGTIMASLPKGGGYGHYSMPYPVGCIGFYLEQR